MLPIEDFCRLVRDSFVGAEHIYTNGSCYYFANLLRALYGGELRETVDHVYLYLDGEYYDIKGKVRPHGKPERAEEPTGHGKFDMLKYLAVARRSDY